MDGQSQPRSTTTHTELYPQARHHTYLPGIITPLLPGSDSSIHTRDINNAFDGHDGDISSRPVYSLPQQQQLRQSPHGEHRPSWVQELAMLELSPESSIDDTSHTASQHSGNNIVIFPGSIVPLRLLDHEWITYLQQQIHSITSNTTGNTTSSSFSAPVRFGILMPRPRNISGGDNDDDNRNDERNRSSIPEQRQSWTRQAHGPASLRRLSDQLIQELGPNFDYDEEDDSSDNDHTDLRNLNSTMITEPEVTVLPTTTTSTEARAASAREEHLPTNNIDNDRLVSHRNDQVFWTLGRRRPRQSGPENIARRARRSTFVAVPLASTSGTRTTTRFVERFHSDEVVTRSQQSQQPYSQPPSELRNRQRDFHVMLEERQRQRNLRATHHRELRRSTNRHTNNNSMDRYIGRIGTTATVMYTHGSNESHSNSADDRRSISTSSLVITAMGTSRFRIIGYRNDDEENEYNNINSGSRHFSGSRRLRHGNLKHFLIEELKDEPLNLPNHCHYRHLPNCGSTVDAIETDDETIATTTFGSLNCYEHYLLHLSIVSPYPHYILRKMWPWKIIANICRYIESVAPKFLSEILLSSRNGNETCIKKGSIPTGSSEKNTLDMLIRSMDPTAFSYWMATNLPFQYEDKIHLLEIFSTIERLHFIYDKLQNEQLYAAMIHCIQCKSPLAFTYDMFTVDGADGTTGNYVNEYGHVHQTITLRSIDEDGVWYQGQPQSKDSWFPGYCWTIMACAVCGHHLGWKFTTNISDSGNVNNSKRPTAFYGVSATNIVTL